MKVTTKEVDILYDFVAIANKMDVNTLVLTTEENLMLYCSYAGNVSALLTYIPAKYFSGTLGDDVFLIDNKISKLLNTFQNTITIETDDTSIIISDESRVYKLPKLQYQEKNLPNLAGLQSIKFTDSYDINTAELRLAFKKLYDVNYCRFDYNGVMRLYAIDEDNKNSNTINIFDVKPQSTEKLITSYYDISFLDDVLTKVNSTRTLLKHNGQVLLLEFPYRDDVLIKYYVAPMIPEGVQ